MTITDMENYLKNKGFEVKTFYDEISSRYTCKITRDGFNTTHNFILPSSIDSIALTNFQKEFLEKMIDSHEKYVRETKTYINNDVDITQNLFNSLKEKISMDNKYNIRKLVQNDKEMKQTLYFHKYKNLLNTNFGIVKVLYNNPATIVFWSDGIKTVVKAQPGDEYDPEKGLAMAIAKRAFGNKGNYCNELKKWLPKEEEESENTFDDHIAAGTVSRPLKQLNEIIQKNFDFNKQISNIQRYAYDSLNLKNKNTKREAVQKAYDMLVKAREENYADYDINKLIGYLGEALED